MITKNELQNKIVLGDCLAWLRTLPSESVDLVVTSPPYNIGKEYESRRALGEYLAEQSEVIAECYRVLKSSGSIFWQVGTYSNKGALIPLDVKFFPIFEDLGMIPRNRISWIRTHGLHAKRKFSARHETILWFTKTDDYKFNLDAVRVPQKYQNKRSHRGANKGKLTSNPLGKNPGDVWLFQNVKHNHEEQTIHPAQFPEDLIARIVLSATDVGDTVLDPYMGTGTTAVVSKDHNRIYLGAELDRRYYDVAIRRIDGLPDAEGKFPNLKTLRDYCERTGSDPSLYRFDVQTTRSASGRDKSRVYPEAHHREQLEARLSVEENAFGDRIRGIGSGLPDIDRYEFPQVEHPIGPGTLF